MNKEIKFRAWDDIIESMYYQDDNESLGEFIESNVPYGRSLEQFTGLFDGKGAEIYEGDILLYIHNTGGIEVVKKIDGCFCLCEPGKENTDSPFCQLDTTPIKNIKWLMDYRRIGNIRENPELIAATDGGIKLN